MESTAQSSSSPTLCSPTEEMEEQMKSTLVVMEDGVLEMTPTGLISQYRPSPKRTNHNVETMEVALEPGDIIPAEDNDGNEEDMTNDSSDVDSCSEADEDEGGLTPAQLRKLLEEDLEEPVPDDVHDPSGYAWSQDFSQFQGERENFNEDVGPKIEGTSPMGIFTQLWDQPLMESIVRETNNYAWETIAAACEAEGGIPPSSRVNAWVETSVDELYRLIGVIILMSRCVRGRISEYWTTGILAMPRFRKLMTANRYMLLLRFLHFVDNATILSHGQDRRYPKIKPLVDHLNIRFQAAYTPRREVCIVESLLLRRGSLRWIGSLRSKAARIGIKSYELCEAVSGYVLNILIDTGKDPKPMALLFEFACSSAKIVLSLFKNYLGKGHTLFMDSFCNSISLCGFLKSNKTDVVGTLNLRRLDAPADIKAVSDRTARGTVVGWHCGDVSVVCWNDVRLVTAVSTYHTDALVEGRRNGETIMNPAVLETFNKFMGGVHWKAQSFSMYPMEKKLCKKWYIIVFRRLLDITILNSYIIYSANMGQREKLTLREFRYRLAEELTQRFGTDGPVREVSGNPQARLDRARNHFPEQSLIPGERTKSQDKFKRERCFRCAVRKEWKMTSLWCSQCKVYLCVGQCWKDFHTLDKL